MELILYITGIWFLAFYQYIFSMIMVLQPSKHLLVQSCKSALWRTRAVAWQRAVLVLIWWVIFCTYFFSSLRSCCQFLFKWRNVFCHDSKCMRFGYVIFHRFFLALFLSIFLAHTRQTTKRNHSILEFFTSKLQLRYANAWFVLLFRGLTLKNGCHWLFTTPFVDEMRSSLTFGLGRSRLFNSMTNRCRFFDRQKLFELEFVSQHIWMICMPPIVCFLIVGQNVEVHGLAMTCARLNHSLQRALNDVQFIDIERISHEPNYIIGSNGFSFAACAKDLPESDKPFRIRKDSPKSVWNKIYDFHHQSLYNANYIYFAGFNLFKILLLIRWRWIRSKKSSSMIDSIFSFCKKKCKLVFCANYT